MKISIQQVREICRRYGITPDKSAGQHFLLDVAVIEQALLAAAVRKTDTIVEVGPGLGVLTEALLEQAGRVVAIELDQRLARFLQARFFDAKNFTLLEGDALHVAVAPYVPDGYKVVANIPYGITSRLIKNFLTAAAPPQTMTLLVQREVAERICAKPGQMSLLSILVQLYGQPRIVQHVPADRFWPPPNVDSALLHIDQIIGAPQLERRLDGVAVDSFWRVARIGFSSRRKQLHNTLSAGLRLEPSLVQDLLRQAKLEPSVRAQALTIKDWVRVAKIFKNHLN